MIRALWLVARYQLAFLRRTPDRLLPLATVPLFTAAFLAIAQHSGRRDLAGTVVLGAGLIGIWSSALYVSGDIIDMERVGGTLEPTVAAPAPLAVVVLARIGTVTAVSFLGLLEGAAVAVVFFGQRIVVYHVAALVAALLCTWVAMAGTATLMSALFVLARSARTFQNSLSYPFYLLSGAVVPVALLPGWLQPLSNVVFLSWAAELMRACLRPEPPAYALPRMAAIVGLGAVGFGLGMWSINVILRRLRHLGTLGYA
jgi:ABC-2 type transport system permease protein